MRCFVVTAFVAICSAIAFVLLISKPPSLPVSQSTPPANLWLIAVLGDSIAAGQAPLPPGGIVLPTAHADRLWTFTRGGQWRQAFDPMASVSAVYGGSLYPVLEATPIGSGFALPLAQQLADLTANVNIGVVNVGVGGSSIAQHAPSTDTATIYGAGRALINAAKGKVKLVVYSGGVRESQNLAAANALVSNFTVIVNQLRLDYGNDLIVFHLQLGDDPNDAANFPYWQQAKAQQAMISIPGVHMIKTDGVTKQTDKIHYDVAGNTMIGALIAYQFRSLSTNDLSVR